MQPTTIDTSYIIAKYVPEKNMPLSATGMPHMLLGQG